MKTSMNKKIIVATLGLLLTTVVVATQWSKVINSNAPASSIDRIGVPRTSFPGCFINAGSVVDDTAIIGWNNGTGEYEKISCTSTYQWEETSFEDTGGHSPLLIDLARNGFQTGIKGEIVFYDLLDSGQKLKIRWVSVGTDDGFLSLDLNQNGIIDNGAELFGEGTDLLIGDQIGSKALHGYIALAQYDDVLLGGNGDSNINQQDAVWQKLLAWVDRDANGYSDSSELLTMEEAGILSINLNFKESNRRDSAGNRMPYWSWVRTSEVNGPKRVRMVDIYFKEVD